MQFEVLGGAYRPRPPSAAWSPIGSVHFVDEWVVSQMAEEVEDLARYIAKRIAWGVVTLALFATALFFLINILMPGDFMTQFRLGLSADQRAELASQLGIDRPLWQQYWDWMSGMVTGDLGVAFVGDSVARLVVGAMATSLMLFFAGVLIAFPIGNLLGRIGSWKRSGFFLGSTTLVAIVFFTAFPPSLAFLLERGLQNTTTPGTYLALTNLENGAWRQARLFGGVPAADGVVPEPSDILWGMVLTSILALAVVLLINVLIRRVRRRGLPLLALMGSTLAASWMIWVLVGWRSQALDLLGVLLLPMIGVVLLFYGEIQLVTEAAMEEARRRWRRQSMPTSSLPRGPRGWMSATSGTAMRPERRSCRCSPDWW